MVLAQLPVSQRQYDPYGASYVVAAGAAVFNWPLIPRRQLWRPALADSTTPVIT